jgi:hypothetical protein
MKPQRDKRGKFVKTRAPATADDIGFVIVEHDRRTGKVTFDAEFAEPLEAAAMLQRAAMLAVELLDDADEGD